MRWSVALVAALVAALVLPGCSSKDEPPAADIGIAATDLTAGSLPQTMFPLTFAGGTREGTLAIDETFAPTDLCPFGLDPCAASGQRTYDLTSIVPADVPVEMSVDITVDAEVDLGFAMADAQFIRMDEESQGGSVRLDATLVRLASGTVTLVLQFEWPGFGSVQGVTLQGAVRTVTHADVVPALLPVAVELGPGDVVNATADGLQQFVAFPPSGKAVRAVQYPYSLVIPDDAPRGTWFLVGDADEPLRVTGPNRTLSARLLEFQQTDPVDVPANQATTFTMDVAGHPLLVGLELESQRQVEPFFGVLLIMGAHTPALVSPDQVQVLTGTDESAGCLPWCSFNPIGSFTWAYQSVFLDEHLTPGTFTATVEMTTANGVTASAWALSIRQA
jgi:hypothetical protein